MTGQVQCPNCGGYKTETHTTLVDKKSGRPLIIQPKAAMWMVFFCNGVLSLWVSNLGSKLGDLERSISLAMFRVYVLSEYYSFCLAYVQVWSEKTLV